MGTLIIISGGISYLTNPLTGRIVIASVIAFAVSMILDTVVYQLLFKKRKIIKINGSNIISAVADSIIFPTIAFGGFSLWLTIGQFLAKVFGGFIWSLFLSKNIYKKEFKNE